MFLLIVTQEVEAYDRFKTVFDAHPPSHGGAMSHSICRKIDDPNTITIISAFTSPSRPRRGARPGAVRGSRGRWRRR